MVNRLDYRSKSEYKPHPLQTLTRVAVFTILTTAVLYLLLLHVEPGAPFRQGGQPPAREALIENLISAHDAAMQQLAGDGNLEMHIVGVPVDMQNQPNPFGAIYFHWNYLQYPHRVFAGRNDKIINNDQQLFAADTLPDDAWLKSHHVNGVMTLLFQPGQGIAGIARPLK
jgi:hypothetical protein